MDKKYLTKLHHDILMIMDEVDRICRANHLRYYLMCGSCIGAVRHKGFIPWDDDLDIAMPFKDFSRFIELVSEDNREKGVLSDSFYLRWITTEKYYNHSFAKVCLKRTVFQESNGPAAKNAGIYIDVFPLYSCMPYGKAIEIKNSVVTFLENCIHYKGAEKKPFGWNVKRWPIKILSKIFSNSIIYKLMLMIIRPLEENRSDFQAFYATPYPMRRMVFPKNWHGEGKKLLFEGRYYVCPIETDCYLKQIYGKDVMQLPPENKRKSHYPLRVVFSDGEEMIFKNIKNRVSYKDIIG